MWGRWHLRNLLLDKSEKTLTISNIDKFSHKKTVIYQWEAVMIRDLTSKGSDTKCSWKHSFVLETKYRAFKFFTPTEEERDLWVESFHLYMGIPV